jgi:Ran GTPase-activating protein (RanGAP) involved in mRNA processing and transport
LDFSNNAIGHDGANDLAKALGIWHSLKDLNLANNNIGTEGMKTIAEGMRTLETLDATHTSCGVQGATSLVCAIGLKRLRLFNNELSSEGFQAIAALIPNIKLLELDLGATKQQQRTC